jgi:Tfp pilus assembly protein PilP
MTLPAPRRLVFENEGGYAPFERVSTRRLVYCLVFSGMLYVPLQTFAQEPLHTIPLEHLQIARISPSDERAVIKMPNGTLQIIKAGDAIGNRDGRVTEIAPGRVVIEENVGGQVETVIVWLEDGTQRVERFSKTGEPAPPMFAPQRPPDTTRDEQGARGSFTDSR